MIYGGLVIILYPAGGISVPVVEDFLITEDGLDILTESSDQILVEE